MDDGDTGAQQVTCGESELTGTSPADPDRTKGNASMAATPPPSSRESRVKTAVRDWQTALIDVSRRNPLLYYKDLTASTLDLADVTPETITGLVKGKSLRIGNLLGDSASPERRGDAQRRLRTIYQKIAALSEERGVRSGYLALGMATWHDAGYQPAAPILLYPIDITPTGSRQEDFRLEVDDDPTVNPVLLEYLADNVGIEIGDDQFPIPNDANPDSLLSVVSRQLWRAAHERLPGFSIQRRQVIAAFSYAKLPMVKDLEASGALLNGHDVITAISGDPQAQERLRAQPSAEPGNDPDGEYLVLDADSSQSEAIRAVSAGSSLVIKGPPGTGKSQTIVNLIATLIAQGKRVLFVAEKRAAIDVVMRRLDDVGLADLVMDAHDGAKARTRIIDGLKTTLEKAAEIGKPDVADLHDRLRRSYDTLQGYREVVFTPRAPWQRSIFDAQCTLLELGEEPVAPITDDTLDKLDPDTATEVLQALREYADLGGFQPDADETAWRGGRLPDTDAVTRALAAADELVDLLPKLVQTVTHIATTTRTRPAADLDGLTRRLHLLDGIAATDRAFDRLIWSAPLPDWLAATATRQGRREYPTRIGWLRRRRLNRHIKSTAHGSPSRSDLHERLQAAADQWNAWREVNTDGTEPFAPASLDTEHDLLTRVRRQVAHLADVFDRDDLDRMPLTELTIWVNRLAADRVNPPRLSRLTQLRTRLTEIGLDAVLSNATGDADNAAAFFERSLASAIIATAAKNDTRFHRVNGDLLRQARDAFIEADKQHIASNPERVRRAAAERLYAARDAHTTQETFLKKQLVRKRRHASLRALFEEAPDILTAVTPCVAMSPLVVSQQLPARRLFDVVIFDEASQVPVSDAVPAIMRADQVVVTGDVEQLPPTRFFASVENESDDEDLSVASGLESILESMEVLLPTRSLVWHYRSRDERLIDFSNRNIYDRKLITFAGREPAAVSHVLCHGDSPVQAEAERVVQLVLEHARNHPDRSLGVITMNIKHAKRIEELLYAARVEHPELDAFFATDTVEPFFIKNLERVQGDERDAIIMSLGYAKSPSGRMRHHFGPLNQDGGHRRLNVAITRAKYQMTTVSTFSADDLDPERLNAPGARMLRDYLEYIASAETAAPVSHSESALNAFEQDVRMRLEAAEIPVIARYGVSRHRIDIAVPHPRQPGRMVLAIEIDGIGLPGDMPVRDRDRLRSQVLSGMGWAVHRIWSPDWFKDPITEVVKARAAYNAAIIAADAPPIVVEPPTQREPEAGSAPKAAPESKSKAKSKAKAKANTKTMAKSKQKPKAAPRKRRQCPINTARMSIREYSAGELVMLIAWIKEDQQLRTEDELLTEAIKTLGFKRRGPRIVEALTKAIAATD